MKMQLLLIIYTETILNRNQLVEIFSFNMLITSPNSYQSIGKLIKPNQTRSSSLMKNYLLMTLVYRIGMPTTLLIPTRNLMIFCGELKTVLSAMPRSKKLNKKQLKGSQKPWITNDIIKLIGHRDRLFRQKKDNPINQRIKRAYNLFRNRTTREIKKAKKKYYKDYFNNNLNNMKKTWKGIKQIINLNNVTGPQISQLSYEGKTINSIKVWQMLLMISLPKLALN